MDLKKRIAVFLCLLLTIPAIMGALPQAKLEAQAATTVSVNWQGISTGDNDEAVFEISTKTAGFYMGDYLYAYSYGNNYKNYGSLSMNSGVKYKSSNTSVAAINSTTGLVSPKKSGSTKITISFKGVYNTCTLKVVSNFGSGPAEYNSLKKCANALIKGYGKKITTSSRYKVVNLNNIYEMEQEQASYSSVSRYFGVESIYQQSGSEWGYTNKAKMPILCILCVMPFLIHLAEYDYGYSSYLWHSDNSVAQDLYAYYRSYFFALAAVISMFVLAFRMGLYREKNKPGKIYVSLAVYSICAGVSVISSVNQRASLTGNFYQFQSIFVLTGFCLMSFYTYQIMESEQDYRTVANGMMAAFVLLSVVDWFQVFGHDLLNVGWVQHLVMSGEQYAAYGGEITDVFSGNNVFLTLYNPNYAAVFLVMMAAVLAALVLGEKEKKQRMFYLVLLLSTLILLWFTYTRAALVALAVGAIVLSVCAGKSLRKYLKYMVPGTLILAAVLIGADACNGFRYLSRMTDTDKDAKLEDIRTTQEGVTIVYDGKGLVLTLEDGALSVAQEDGTKVPVTADETKTYQIPFSTPVPAMVLEDSSIYLLIEDTSLEFVKTEEGYFYRNEDGKLDVMTEIPHVDMGGLEYLGSGRFYIWSRVFPMLKDYLLVGSGPDTFAEVFPQNDYVGKILYAGTPRRVIEGAHNDYLTRWVQTGLVSLVSLLVFYVLFLRRCFSYYRSCSYDTRKGQLGFGCFLGCCCYLTCCFFTDSSLYTTPVFYVFAGIALSAAKET